jgi:hypothetical protein
MQSVQALLRHVMCRCVHISCSLTCVRHQAAGKQFDKVLVVIASIHLTVFDAKVHSVLKQVMDFMDGATEVSGATLTSSLDAALAAFPTCDAAGIRAIGTEEALV